MTFPFRIRRSHPGRPRPPLPAVLGAVLALALVAGACDAPQPPLALAAPDGAGFDHEALDAAVDLYRERVDDDRLRNVVLLVARDGQVVLHEALGWRNNEEQLPMEPNTLIRMASNTKAVITTAALILHEEGRLSIDDPVANYIPAFGEGDLAKITVRHLMTNSSGLPRGPIFLSGVSEDSDLVREAERFAETLELASEPGTEYGYSNAGFNVLGGVIEAVSGQNLEEFLTERIYEPLGMTDSNNFETRADNSRMSVVYRGEDARPGWSPGDDPSFPIVRASGGMISTAWDYAVFMQMWLNGGRFGDVQILSEESVEEGLSVQSATQSYGFGWQISSDGRTFSHGGSDGTHAYADRDRGLIVLVFTQHPGGDNPRSEFFRMVRDAIVE